MSSGAQSNSLRGKARPWHPHRCPSTEKGIYLDSQDVQQRSELSSCFQVIPFRNYFPFNVKSTLMRSYICANSRKTTTQEKYHREIIFSHAQEAQISLAQSQSCLGSISCGRPLHREEPRALAGVKDFYWTTEKLPGQQEQTGSFRGLPWLCPMCMQHPHDGQYSSPNNSHTSASVLYKN